MKVPCEDCIVLSCCSKLCIDLTSSGNELDYNIKQFKRFIFSKNKHRRKHIPENKRLHWNSLVSNWNRRLYYHDMILDRFYKIEKEKARVY